MNRGGLVLAALVAVLAVGGIAWFAMSMDGPVEPANKAAVAKARKNYLRLARNYRAGYRHYEGRKRWARQMNRVCYFNTRRQRVILARLRRVGRLQSFVAIFRDSIRATQRSLDRARTLRPPPADRARVRRMFAVYDQMMSYADPIVHALARKDFRTVDRLVNESGVPARRANRIATALGAAVCSRDID